MPRTVTRMRPDDIRIGKRIRKDLGDLTELADDLTSVGLMHAVVVTPEGEPIAGRRRLEAARQFGWRWVPVRVMNITDFLRGECSENVCRKPLLPSECMAVLEYVRPMEREAAKERQREHGHTAPGRRRADSPGKLPRVSAGGRVRDRVAVYVGISGKTLEKAAAVVQAAKEDPQRYGRLVERMDRSGRVHGAFRELGKLRQIQAKEAAPPPLPEGPYSVIVVDPPWRYTHSEGDLSETNAAPYATMTWRKSRAWRWPTSRPRTPCGGAGRPTPSWRRRSASSVPGASPAGRS